ncbi:LolA family protein [Diaminobutyricibacter sp. McL0608]|uniref:LolA family protein n=1 Tax=Leifsonia sp. McL0608 TaxID=3143537 RepID=UPI0031F2E10C
MLTRAWLRWLPAVAVPAVIAAGAVIIPMQAGAAVNLPARTPSELLALVANSKVEAFSGTVEQTSNLGLPQLPTTGPGSDSSDASILDLVTASHTARVYADGPTKQRVQVMDSLAERDAIRNGTDAWLYQSKDNSATHITVPAKSANEPSTQDGVVTPAEIADKLLAKIDPSTTVTLGDNQSVAGRNAYELVLTPKTSATLVGSVAIAVDAETGLPLQVVVDARGQHDPAFTVGFTSIDLATPSASMFTFTPPAGATVKQQALPKAPTAPKQESGHPKPTVTGTGWDAVVELTVGSVPASVTSNPLYGELTTPVAGGRALSTSLVSVLLTDDGRVFAGAVPVSRLEAVAAQ